MKTKEEWIRGEESPTLKSIEEIQATVDKLKEENIDAVFIYSALAQVIADLQASHDIFLTET